MVKLISMKTLHTYKTLIQELLTQATNTKTKIINPTNHNNKSRS